MIDENTHSTDTYNVAVLTTLYSGDNTEFARIALDSLLAQDIGFDRVHVYLYIDGPIDQAQKDLISEYAEHFHKVVAGQTNLGLPTGLNTLLGHLSGERYVFRMDLDDICESTRFRRQCHFMDSHPQIDLCGCNAIEIDDNSKLIKHRTYPEYHDDIVSAMPKLNPILHPTYCFRYGKYISDPFQYQEAYLSEDIALLFSLVKRGWQLQNLQETLFSWRTGQKFFERRTLHRAVGEFQAWTRGMRSLDSTRPVDYLYPIGRFLTRLLPKQLNRLLYASSLRDRLSGK